ncbi:hypothetical protein YTPLAS72_01850 [Nitrospira sp.]|nr:hypothetical protein YTPLAS72_01850 [Nitrospira sp.]
MLGQKERDTMRSRGTRILDILATVAGVGVAPVRPHRTNSERMNGRKITTYKSYKLWKHGFRNLSRLGYAGDRNTLMRDEFLRP